MAPRATRRSSVAARNWTCLEIGGISGPSVVMLEHSVSSATNMSSLENKATVACVVATPQPHAMFNMLTIDPTLRGGIRVDMLRFVQWRKHFVRRSHLEARVPTHGLSGTDKTSLITAITNLLKFNIYDLDITIGAIQHRGVEHWRRHRGGICS